MLSHPMVPLDYRVQHYHQEAVLQYVLVSLYTINSLHIDINRKEKEETFQTVWQKRRQQSKKVLNVKTLHQFFYHIHYECRRLFSTPNISEPLPGTGSQLLTYRQLLEPNPLATGFGATLMVTMLQDKVRLQLLCVCVTFITNQVCAVPFRLDLTVDDILLTCCKV